MWFDAHFWNIEFALVLPQTPPELWRTGPSSLRRGKGVEAPTTRLLAQLKNRF
jgi:hypothetical protein